MADFIAPGGRAHHMRARPPRLRRRLRASSRSADGLLPVAELAPGIGERVLPEQRRRRGPCLRLAGAALGARLGAERDQLGEIVHRLDAARRRDPHEAVGVEVVAEEQSRIGVGRLEQPRRAVVEEVALVDRLHARGRTAPRRAARRRARPRAPRRAGASRPTTGSRPPPRTRASPRGRAQLPRSSPTASIVASISSSPCASETNMHSNWDGAR